MNELTCNKQTEKKQKTDGKKKADGKKKSSKTEQTYKHIRGKRNASLI